MHPPWPHPVFSDIPAHTGLRSAPPGRHREVVDEFAGGCLVGERAPEAMMASPVTTRNALPGGGPCQLGAERVSTGCGGVFAQRRRRTPHQRRTIAMVNSGRRDGRSPLRQALPAQPAGCRMAGRGDRNMTRLRIVATAFGRKPDSHSARDQYARRRLRALCLAAFLVISAALVAGPTRLLPTCLVGCRPSQAGITAVGQPQCRPARPRVGESRRRHTDRRATGQRRGQAHRRRYDPRQQVLETIGTLGARPHLHADRDQPR
jgi:hypothetical protein